MKKLDLSNMVSMDENSLNFGGMFKSIFIAYILCIVLLGVFSIVLTYTNFPESSIPSVVLAITIICIIYAAQMSARSAKNRGWLIGAETGLIFIIILYIISMIFTQRATFDAHLLVMFVLAIAVGAVGGIIGINLKKPEKRHK